MNSGQRDELSDSIREAFRRQEAPSAVADFDSCWAAATRRQQNPPRRWSFATRLVPAFAFAALVVIGLWWLRPAQDIQPALLSMSEVPPDELIFDPNLPWYAPTDDLLQLGVRRYESWQPGYIELYLITLETQ